MNNYRQLRGKPYTLFELFPFNYASVGLHPFHDSGKAKAGGRTIGFCFSLQF